jgi:hypothetical protein
MIITRFPHLFYFIYFYFSFAFPLRSSFKFLQVRRLDNIEFYLGHSKRHSTGFPKLKNLIQISLRYFDNIFCWDFSTVRQSTVCEKSRWENIRYRDTSPPPPQKNRFVYSYYSWRDTFEKSTRFRKNPKLIKSEK